MKKLLVLLIFVSFQSVFADVYPFFSPGVYIGWEFGENSGAVVGLEISGGIIDQHGLIYGGVYGHEYNFLSKVSKNSIDAEFGTPFYGGSLGYEFTSNDKNSPRVSGWLGVIAYTNITLAPYSENFLRAGLSGKIPISNAYFYANEIEGFYLSTQ